MTLKKIFWMGWVLPILVLAASCAGPTLLEIQTSAGKVLTSEYMEQLESLYDGEIRYTDEVLGKLIASLEAIGFLDNAIIVVTSDHGEEFGEHGGVLHGGKLFDLHHDPGEKRNLSARRPDLRAALLSELEEWRAGRPQLDLGARQHIELTQEVLEELRALGYVE